MISLPIRLREATGAAHRRLEHDLDLLGAAPDRERFTALLKRFWGFHAVWEPAMADHAGLRALFVGRSRLNLIRDDLGRLGLSGGEIDALPRCAAAASLCSTDSRGIGSLYVLEGSTLGGRMITRALLEAPWLPAGGLAYFDPYGARTGVMWRGFQDALTAASSPIADPGIEQGAIETFELLTHWLA